MIQSFFFILFFFFVTLTAQSKTDCSSYIGHCDYYLCLENENHCGSEGYYLHFAYHYCDKYQKRSHKYSDAGQVFLKNIRSCLQLELENITTLPACQDIKLAAIETHKECYKKYGYCDLKWSDRLKIQWMAKREIFDSEMSEFAQYLNDLCYPH